MSRALVKSAGTIPLRESAVLQVNAGLSDTNGEVSQARPAPPAAQRAREKASDVPPMSREESEVWRGHRAATATAATAAAGRRATESGGVVRAAESVPVPAARGVGGRVGGHRAGG